MATQLQRRRGTTAQHAAFTGAAGETTVDTTLNGVRVHDGSTAGGHLILPTAPSSPVGGSNTSSSSASLPATSGSFTAPTAGKLIIVADAMAGADGLFSGLALTASGGTPTTTMSVLGSRSAVARGYLTLSAGASTTVTATATTSSATGLTVGVFAFFLPQAS